MPWYRLRSGVLYHAVRAVPPGAVLVDDGEAEELIAAGQGNETEGTEVAGDDLSTDGGQGLDGPAVGPDGPGVDDEVDDGEGS